jgi:hypothetical protein
MLRRTFPENFDEILEKITHKKEMNYLTFRKSVHHQTNQIIQPTRCNSFTSLVLDVYMWLNMFRVSPHPSSGAYNCTRSPWFYRCREAAGALLVVVWNLPDHDQQRSSGFFPMVKSEATSAVVCS